MENVRHSNLNLLNFSVGFDQLVSYLQEHPKREVSFLYGGQHLGFIDITAGQHRMHHRVGVGLHLVDPLNFTRQQLGELIDTGAGNLRARCFACDITKG